MESLNWKSLHNSALSQGICYFFKSKYRFKVIWNPDARKPSMMKIMLHVKWKSKFFRPKGSTIIKMGYVPWPWENLSITKFGYGQVKLRNSEFGFVQMSSITQYIICSTHTVTDWAGLLKNTWGISTTNLSKIISLQFVNFPKKFTGNHPYSWSWLFKEWITLSTG